MLFFAVDDLRPEIEIFGGVPGTPSPKMHTPNIEALAKRSLVLTKNYVQQAVCSPTRQSILTGRRPDRTRVYDLYVYFRDVAANYTTIPQWFRMHGYNMSGMGKIFHPGHASGRGTDVGEHDYCCSWDGDNDYYWPKDDHQTEHTNAWEALDEAAVAADPPADFRSADHAVELLDDLPVVRKRGDSRPFFMGVGFHKPHLPFVVEQKYLDLYPEDSIELPHDQQPPKDMPQVAWSNWAELRTFDDQAQCAKQNNITGQPGEVLPKAMCWHFDVPTTRRCRRRTPCSARSWKRWSAQGKQTTQSSPSGATTAGSWVSMASGQSKLTLSSPRGHP